MPSTRARRTRSRRKKRSPRKYYSPSPIRGAPHVNTSRGGKKKRSGTRKNLGALFANM